MTKSERYSIEEHRHRFAVWAAGRAAQRGLQGATVARLSEALEKADLQTFAINPPKECRASDFDAHHRRWSQIIRSHMNGDLSYGRAAKLIAVYLKAMIICGPHGPKTDDPAQLDNPSLLINNIHPPIDRVLLSELKENKIIQEVPAWTTLDEPSYFKLVDELRVMFPEFWTIEQYWDRESLSS